MIEREIIEPSAIRPPQGLVASGCVKSTSIVLYVHHPAARPRDLPRSGGKKWAPKKRT